jgi:hypothetical protein
MSDIEIARLQKADNEQSGAEPLGLTAEQIDQLYDMGCGLSLLWLVRATWLNHAFPAEPYCDKAALEIAINELIDEARTRGYRVTYRETEVEAPYGLLLGLEKEEEQP